MEKLYLILFSPRHNKGFILLELMLSIIITAFLATLLLQGFSHILPGWNRLRTHTNLYNAGHYMLNTLEKNVGYESTNVSLSKDLSNQDMLICQTVQGNQSFTFTCESKHIYKTITKGSSSGKNPLYISDCLVEGWSWEKLNNKQFYVQLTLAQEGKRCTIARIITCLNGDLSNEA